jgi:hypothetical protein
MLKGTVFPGEIGPFRFRADRLKAFHLPRFISQFRTVYSAFYCFFCSIGKVAHFYATFFSGECSPFRLVIKMGGAEWKYEQKLGEADGGSADHSRRAV